MDTWVHSIEGSMWVRIDLMMYDPLELIITLIKVQFDIAELSLLLLRRDSCLTYCAGTFPSGRLSLILTQSVVESNSKIYASESV